MKLDTSSYLFLCFLGYLLSFFVYQLFLGSGRLEKLKNKMDHLGMKSGRLKVRVAGSVQKKGGSTEF